MPQLIIRNREEDWEIELGERTRIGRVLENDVCLQDASISRHHAEIVCADEGYLFKDLGSSNGSYIRDVRIAEKLLGNGDAIRIGKTILTFIEDLTDSTPTGLVRIASNPVSERAIKDRIEVGGESAFAPAHLITDSMDWREDYEKLRLGNELLQHVGLQRDLGETLKSITGKLLEIFPADRCAILLLDSETDALVPMAVKVLPGIPKHMSISESILEEVRRSHSALFVADVTADERFSHSASILVQGLHSVLCAPIIYNNHFFGVIHLDSQKSAMVFSRKDLQLITSLVAHVATIIANTKLLQSVERESRDKAQLERLLPPSVMQKITSGELRLEKKGGKLKKITILFVDIRGFTSMAHSASATDVVEMLNEYFELIVSIVFQYGGTVDKFIGDEVMVLFDALTEVEYPADRAVKCAFHMHGALDLFNRERKARGKKPIEIGIGINSGDAVVGAIGSSQAMQYTCIGDAVNIAARLTSMAKPRQTIISEDTFRNLKLKPKHSMLPQASLKGIARPIQLYSVWEKVTDTTLHH
ncbi:MAG: adenylate/guanylate cyclase domain-containing protein [Mariprofundaceae bacterium]|nr:adenylate/guanylate cyclase domain-containing protein [Mariprofundaceae bacterium]